MEPRRSWLFGVARELHCDAPMTNDVLYAALGATGDPLTTNLISIDGSLVMAVGLAALLIAGVLLSVVVRKRRSSKRLTVRHVLHTRRAAV